MMNHDDYRIRNNIYRRGPTARALGARLYLERIRAQQTKDGAPGDALDVQPDPQRSARSPTFSPIPNVQPDPSGLVQPDPQHTPTPRKKR